MVARDACSVELPGVFAVAHELTRRLVAEFHEPAVRCVVLVDGRLGAPGWACVAAGECDRAESSCVGLVFKELGTRFSATSVRYA
jgi:hypothetical protein